MNAEIHNQAIVDDHVVTLNYCLFLQGKEIEKTSNKPIQFIQGRGSIIPGLEKSLYGLYPGDKKRLRINAAEGYGEVDPDAIMKIPKSEFPKEMQLDIGMELEFKNPKGDTWVAFVKQIDNQEVVLDFNHPLAGKELEFEIEVVNVRPATPQELAHGHVHN